MIKNGDIIGPWKVNKEISKISSDRGVYEVSTYQIDVSDLLEKLNGISVWSMKIVNTKMSNSEIEVIKKYQLHGVPNSVIMPIDELYISGRYNNNYEWYIMEKCNGDIHKYIKSAYQNWDVLLECVCNFLKNLHQKKKLIHGDLKLKNILYKASDNTFKVCDYESCDIPDLETTCINNDSIGYYYYYIGAIPNEPILSYKMDLLAFGTILWAVYCNESLENKIFRWQQHAINYYETRCKYNYYEKLEELKSLEFMPKIIEEYFKIVSRVHPFVNAPPSDDIYDDIINLKKYKFKEI